MFGNPSINPTLPYSSSSGLLISEKSSILFSIFSSSVHISWGRLAPTWVLKYSLISSTSSLQKAVGLERSTGVVRVNYMCDVQV